jgi:transposase-like protein
VVRVFQNLTTKKGKENPMSTSPKNDNLLRSIFEVLISHGFEGFNPVLQTLLNEVMKAERSEFLNAAPYERSASRKGHANGYKGKTLYTRVGEMRVRIPQVRGLSFYPQSLDKGCRSEVALKAAIGEMYVQGVATRRVTEITEALCGLEISSSQVSRICKVLDDELDKFRSRPLGEYPFVILDARYEKVRHAGSVRDLAVLVALGVNWEGRREILGASVSLSEAEVHWKGFMQDLQKRGLSGIRCIVSDDHKGLRNARRAIFPSVPWQRCQFHLAQNAQAYVPKKNWRSDIGQVMRDIFNSTSLEEAKEKVKAVIKLWEKKAPDFTEWLEDNVEEGFTVYQFPRPLWRKIRTTNLLENVNREIKRRTRVATLFPNKESCLRLVSAVLQEIHEEWAPGKIYLRT